MDNDDLSVGHVLSRREALALLGTAGTPTEDGDPPRGRRVSSAGHVLPTCVVRPEQTEGPYFVDLRLQRSDIRSDPETHEVPDGIPLELIFHVSTVAERTCTPLRDAVVDVWQCDAHGVYSGVRDTQGRFDTRGKRFLRGCQTTDAAGVARFLTIFPGWYEGRTVHIHFRIRTPAGSARRSTFTSQLYFDDAFTDAIMQRPPYAQRGDRSVRNSQDAIFGEGGDQLMLDVEPGGVGFRTIFAIGVHTD